MKTPNETPTNTIVDLIRDRVVDLEKRRNRDLAAGSLADKDPRAAAPLVLPETEP
jgi:hypothetical protein